MPLKVLITQPSSDQPPTQSPRPGSIAKRLAKQKAKTDENQLEDILDKANLGEGDTAALLAELEGHKPAYKSIEGKRGPSAPPAYGQQSRSPTPIQHNLRSVPKNGLSGLSPAMTQSSYSLTSSTNDDDLFDGLDLEDGDATKLLEEFEVEEYEIEARRRSATPSPARSPSPMPSVTNSLAIKKAPELAAKETNKMTVTKLATPALNPVSAKTPSVSVLTKKEPLKYSLPEKKKPEKEEKLSLYAVLAEQKRAKTASPKPQPAAEPKYGRIVASKEPEKEALLNRITNGGFKLKHVETNDKSSGVLKSDSQDSRDNRFAKSVPPAPKFAAPLAPPSTQPNRSLSPAQIKHGKREPSPREALLNAINAGGFKLKKVETNDRSGLILEGEERQSERSISQPPPPLAPPVQSNRPVSPAQLKHGKKEPSAREALLNSINSGNFKLKKVETSDRSGLIIEGEKSQESRSVSQPPPPPPPGLAVSNPNRAPSPAELKHGKGEASAREELFNSIKTGGFKLKKVEIKDKSGLILDDEMIAHGCRIAENQVAEVPQQAAPRQPKPIAKAAPTPPPPPPPVPAPPKIVKAITNPALLKLGGKDAQVDRAALLNTIKTGGFKLRKVDILDKSAPIMVENQTNVSVSSSGYVSVTAACPPPPPPQMPMPTVPTGPRERKPITNPALLKLGGKDAKPNIEAVFNAIKSGGVQLRRVKTNDKSGLILDDQQKAKFGIIEAAVEEEDKPVIEAKPHSAVKKTKKKVKGIKKEAI